MKNTIKSVGNVMLCALMLLLLLALLAGIAALGAKKPFGAVYWRLCAGADGVIFLMIAIGLLAHRDARKGRNRYWETHFPRIPFLAALLILSVVLTAAGCIVNYLVV